MDSAVFCSFVSFNASNAYRHVFEFLNAVTGWNVTKREWYDTMSKRILHIQRVALLLGGPDARWDPKIHDDNPKRFYEPLPSGPDAGETAEKAEVEELKREYYKAVGWDKKGIPKPKELERLGLKDLTKALERVRK
jgi:aldehyde:ferredoxin oxidoreductase